MAQTKLRGAATATVGELPGVGTTTPAFTLTANDLSEVTEASWPGRRLILNIFPSVDTGVCATSVRKFNEVAGSLDNTTVVCVSADLPFAQARFCGAEGIENVVTASAFRSDFGTSYGVKIAEGPMAGLLARSIVVVDTYGVVLHTELVDDIVHEPNYDAAIAALG